jgi:hypothetical protein
MEKTLSIIMTLPAHFYKETETPNLICTDVPWKINDQVVKLIISSLQAHPAYQTDTTNYVES